MENDRSPESVASCSIKQSIEETMDRQIPAVVAMMDIDSRTAIVPALDAHDVPRLKAIFSTRTGFGEMVLTGKLERAARESARAALDELRETGLITSRRVDDATNRHRPQRH